MSIELVDTRRLLAGDRGLGQHAIGLAAVAVLFGWWVWAATVEIPLTLAADDARVVSAVGPVALAIPSAGRLQSLDVVPGQKLAAGDVIARLDPSGLERALATARANLAIRQAALSGEDRDAELRTLADARAAADLAGRIDIARGEADRTRLAYESALVAADRSRTLAKDGLVAKSAVEAAEATLAQLESANRAAVAAILRLELDAAAAASERAANARAAGEHRAEAQAALDAAGIAVSAAEADLAAAVLRAPSAGSIAEISAYRAGSLVPAGAPIVTLLPDGNRTLAAHVTAPEALARIAAGQPVSFVAAGAHSRRPLAGIVLSVVADADGGANITATAAGTDGLPAGLTGELVVETGRETPLAILAGFLGLWGEGQ